MFCCRHIKAVDIGPVLSTLDRLTFVFTGDGSVNKPFCSVVLQDKFTPELNALVAELGLGGQTARAILRRLVPGQNIAPHVDDWISAEMDWRRFQVPITSHPAIVMRWPEDGVTMHLAPGYLYEVRFDRTHEVLHGADCDRIHLQIDQIGATI